MHSDATVLGRVSHWYRDIPASRPALPGRRDADVCIVGAGFTGLWTAYYLTRADPSLRIVVLEARFAGFGASGRNGGWASALPPGDRNRLAKTCGRDAVLRWQRELIAAANEKQIPLSLKEAEAAFARAKALRDAGQPPSVDDATFNGLLAELGKAGLPAALLDRAEVRSYLRWRLGVNVADRMEDFTAASVDISRFRRSASTRSLCSL